MTDTTKTIQIDQKIPDLEMEAFHNEEIKSIKLSDYKGKWLILPLFALRSWRKQLIIMKNSRNWAPKY